jgi:hypothetical protein
LRFALGLTLGAILYATLQPADIVERVPPWWCVACGDRGKADFILNVILFLPFGCAIGLTGTRWRTALWSGLFLSTFIELTQAFVPGRDTSLGDVISNTCGAVLGFFIAGAIVAAARRHQPPGLRTALATALALAIVGGTGVALKPAYPRSIYSGQWTADLDGGLEWYRGHVLDATLGTMALPSRQLDNQDGVRALLAQGAPLEVTALAGPPPTRLAPLFSIYDEQEREILLIAPRRHDLVIRYWTRSLNWGLDRPYLTLAGAVAGVQRGDTLRLHLWRDSGRLCVAVNGRQDCGLGFTAGAGWSVLIYPESFGAWARALLDATWVWGILLPAGFFATSRPTLIGASAVVLLGLALVPGAVGLHATPAWEWAGAAAGIATGWWGRRALARLPLQPARPPQIVFTSSAKHRSARS